jgi:hypothetical protein
LRANRHIPEADELIHRIGLKLCEDCFESREVAVDV